MKRRSAPIAASLFLAVVLVSELWAASLPNIIIFFLDDSGYGDFSVFDENLDYPTPNVDRLANEGCRYTNFYVPQAICSASRAALLTGNYPERVGILGALAPRVRGLDPKYKILPEYLRAAGYTSAIVGKWHLGDTPDTRPAARGFDFSSGLMYSNDMWKHHPDNPTLWGRYPISYWKNGSIVDDEIGIKDQKQLTQRYTKEATKFIRENANNPFFLYLAHSMPHVPLYSSDEFENRSGAGLYGDVILELDWSVGQINESIKKAGIEENTIVIFTSDNGPWLSYGNHAGKTPFREGKATSFEGGTRSACIIKFPERIKAGAVSEKSFCSIDLVPTLLNLVGVVPPESNFDGKDQWPILSCQTNVTNPQAYYAFTRLNTLEAVMSPDGRWKLHLEHPYLEVVNPGSDGKSGNIESASQPAALYDLQKDPLETENLILKHPDIAQSLNAHAVSHLKRFPTLTGKLLCVKESTK